ncbi:hypothetical protein BS78_09G089500 [Paspalum vaginatum]|nr:hypothetical protein BS78_09G089500 [Paspalum vaginatum]
MMTPNTSRKMKSPPSAPRKWIGFLVFAVSPLEGAGAPSGGCRPPAALPLRGSARGFGHLCAAVVRPSAAARHATVGRPDATRAWARGPAVAARRAWARGSADAGRGARARGSATGAGDSFVLPSLQQFFFLLGLQKNGITLKH